MPLDLRKVVTHTEEVHIEGGQAANPPLRLLGIAAVLTNPWAGQGFVEDLRPTILEIAPRLGEVLVPRLVDSARSEERRVGKECRSRCSPLP